MDFATRDAFSITTRNEKRILQQQSISLSEPVGRLSKYHTKNGRLKKNRTQQRTTLYVGLYYHIPARPLRYSNTSQLSGSPGPQKFFFSRFQRRCPWNSLPSGIHACSSSHTFRRLLKTHCFDEAFSSPYRLTQVPQIRPLADTAHYK